MEIYCGIPQLLELLPGPNSPVAPVPGSIPIYAGFPKLTPQRSAKALPQQRFLSEKSEQASSLC